MSNKFYTAEKVKKKKYFKLVTKFVHACGSICPSLRALVKLRAYIVGSYVYYNV